MDFTLIMHLLKHYCCLRRKFISITQVHKYTSNTKHTIQKAKTKIRKQRLELLKNGKKWGVATMSFVPSRDLIYSSCLSYIFFMQSTIIDEQLITRIFI